MRRPRHGMWLGLGLVAVLAVVLGAGAGSAEASLDVGPVNIPTPGDLLPDIGGGIEDLASKMVSHLVKELFGLEAEVGQRAVRWLLAHPVYTDARAFADLNELRGYVSAAAWGLLGLVFTVSAFRYWASGLTAGGAYEAIEALVRSGVAAGVLIVLPQLFGYASVTGNLMTHALLEAPGVEEGMTKLIGAALLTSLGPLGVGMLAKIVAVVILLLLVVTKIVLATLLAVLYVLAPLAFALWPLPETSWAARTWIQALFAALLWPVLWGVCFAVFAVMGNSVFAVEGSFGSQLVKPWVTVASLYVAFKLPMLVARQALVAGLTPNAGRGAMVTAGYARRVATPSAARPAEGAAKARWGMPSSAGGAAGRVAGAG